MDAAASPKLEADLDSAVAGRIAANTTPYAWYVAGLLSLAQVVAVMDRYLLSVVLESVKHDLRLTDTQLGLLQGPSFVLLFAFASVPFGRFADFLSRRLIITCALMFWSLATAACAFASNFSELFAARLAVGLGEAALLPAALSLIVAYFSQDNLNRGMSVYSMGSSLGRAAGFIGGGAAFGYFAARGGLNLWGFGRMNAWHAVFLTAAAAGIVAALLFTVSVREPARASNASRRTSFRSGLRYFWHRRWAYLSIFLPFSMVNAIIQQLAAWGPSFYQRQHGLSAAAASALIGITGLVCGPVGHLSSGWLCDRLAGRGIGGVQAAVLAGILVLAPVFVVLFALAPSVPVAAGCFGMSYLLMSAAGPPGYAGSQVLTPDEHRGTISAIFLMFYMLLGLGLGPLAAGLAGDHVFHGGAKLGSALILTTLLFALLGFPFALFGRRMLEQAVIARARASRETHDPAAPSSTVR